MKTFQNIRLKQDLENCSRSLFRYLRREDRTGAIIQGERSLFIDADIRRSVVSSCRSISYFGGQFIRAPVEQSRESQGFA